VKSVVTFSQGNDDFRDISRLKKVNSRPRRGAVLFGVAINAPG
jgi:hypothetical protein